MSTLETPPATLDVVAYADAVRRALSDLSREQVDDLTDGLEADLADALADALHAGHGGDLAAQFGDPSAYAAELRAAAGLDGQAPAPRRRGPVRAGRERSRAAVAAVRAQPWWPALAAFGVAVRPLWWVVRGWTAYQLLVSWFGPAGEPSSWIPRSGTGRLMIVLFVVASVQLGRASWTSSRAPRRWVVALNVFAALATIVVASDVSSRQADVAWAYDAYRSGALQYVDPSGAPTGAAGDGVVVGGIPVSNLFVYDADGNPLHDVQVYDDRGRPVRTVSADATTTEFTLPQADEPWIFQPRTGVDGRSMWNVYPLLGAPSSQFSWVDGTPDAGAATIAAPPWPFAKAPAVTPATGVTTPDAPVSAQPGPTP